MKNLILILLLVISAAYAQAADLPIGHQSLRGSWRYSQRFADLLGGKKHSSILMVLALLRHRLLLTSMKNQAIERRAELDFFGSSGT